MFKKSFVLASLAGIVFFLSGCGSDSSTSTSNPFSIAAPALAVSAPTTTSSTSTAALRRENPIVTAMLKLPGIGPVLSHFKVMVDSQLAIAAEKEDAPPLEPPGTGVENAKADFKGDPSTVAAKVGDLRSLDKYRAKCFGAPIRTTLQNGGSAGSARDLPGGDLGILYTTVSDTDTKPCSVGEVDSLIASQPGVFNKIFKLSQAMMAKAKAEGESLPAIGSSIDVTMPAVTGLTFTTAKLERVADGADGNAIYVITIEATTTTSKTISITLRHSPHNADNTNFAGWGKAVLPHTPSMGGAGEYRAISISYEQADGVQHIEVKTAANRTTSSTDFFDATTKDVKHSGTAFGEDGHWMIMTFNTSTNAGTLRYGWMAGSGDGGGNSSGGTRVFEVTTDGTNGRAFFGFGAVLSSLSGSANKWGTRMYCDWTNGTSGGTSQTLLQKQTFTKSTTTGKYVVGTDNFRFHTSASCDASGSYVISEEQTSTGDQTPSFIEATVSSNLTNALVAASTNDIPAIGGFTYTIPRP